MGGKLVVRLGSMGDIIHTIPAVVALGEVTWMIKPKWAPLIEGHPAVKRILTTLPRREFDEAYDFQGLIKSAVAARLGAGRVYGFADPREWPARIFYTRAAERKGAHVVDHNLSLTASNGPAKFWLPMGRPEGKLPDRPFVLASPGAGWRGKEWPSEYWARLRALLPLPLILNGPPGSGLDHESGIPGLIDATRRATAVIGVDSGPLHLAAALGKPGVAIFGPTDPARNGPYGGSIRVLRSSQAVTTYKRRDEIDPSMAAITPEAVAAALTEMP